MNMKALFYYVVNTDNTKERYSMGCNNALKKCELKIAELRKINPLNSYRIVTNYGRI